MDKLWLEKIIWVFGLGDLKIIIIYIFVIEKYEIDVIFFYKFIRYLFEDFVVKLIKFT